MITIKRTLSTIVITLLFVFESSSAIKDSLFATVGQKAITKSDIVNEIKLILILSGQEFASEQRDQLQSAAVKSTIKRNIKAVEIEKFKNLQYDEKELEQRLNSIAANINMDLATLKNTLIANDIDFSAVVDQIKTELKWNTLIFQLYKDRLSINIEEIDEQLKQIDKNKKINEYLISEIIFKPKNTEKIESEINEIKDKINNLGFESVAMDISVSESAIRGGDLGWVNERVISQKFKDQIIKTAIGSVSEPIFLSEGILLFKIRDKRAIKVFENIEEAKKKIVNAEKSKILNIHSLSHYDKVKRSVLIKYY